MPSKYKNSDKIPEKLHGREWKTSPRHGSAGGAVSANAYNPYSGTFHAIATDPGTVNHSSRLKNVDDGEDNASSVGASGEYDSVSNNESCSGESEDQSQAISKEKHGTAGSGSPPGFVLGSEKRDKTRWKNEKKHQRQKERRAKDLKDRSTGYLMSRKLEVLSEQLVSMGFSIDRATMALILNEGHVEKSVAWLLEGGDEQVKEGWKLDSELKIDISEELARIAELEIVYKYPRADVERAIVVCQGNVDKVIEWLRDHYPSVSESSAKIGKVNVAQEASAISQKADCLSFENLSAQLQLAEAHCNNNTFHVVIPHRSGDRETSGNQSKVLPHGRLPARNYEATSGAGSLVKNASIGPEKLKVSSKSYEQVVNCKLQIPHSDPRVASSIPNCVIPTVNLRSSSQIKNLPESNKFEPKNLDVTSQPSSEIEHSSHPSAGSGNYVGCTMSHPSVTAHSIPPHLKNYNNTSSPMPSSDVEELPGVNLNGVIGTSFPALELHRSNTAVLKMKESSKSLNSIRSTFTVSDTVCSKNLELSAPNFPKLVPLSSELLTGWAFGVPGEYVDWNMAAIGVCDYRTIDWSMQPSPSWGIHKTSTTSNLPDESKVQNFSSDLISSFQCANLCSSFPSSLANSFDIWTDAKLRGNLKTLGPQESDSAHRSSSLGEWTSPFDGKDLFTLSHQTVSSPSL